MKTQWMALAACAVLLTTGCASARSDSGLGGAKVAITEPEIVITQISTVADVARNITGALPVQYRIRIVNKANQPITLKRLEIQSIGMGAYTLSAQSRPFQAVIPQDGATEVQFWGNASIQDVTIVGANGPVTLRAVAQFDSPLGQFQHAWTQQVHDSSRGQ